MQMMMTKMMVLGVRLLSPTILIKLTGAVQARKKPASEYSSSNNFRSIPSNQLTPSSSHRCDPPVAKSVPIVKLLVGIHKESNAVPRIDCVVLPP